MALTAQEIRQRDLRYKKQSYEWAKARGLCVRCMKERTAPGRYKCLECLSISVELNNVCNAKLSQDEKKTGRAQQGKYENLVRAAKSGRAMYSMR